MARRGSNEPDNPRERRWQREKRERQYNRIVGQLNLLHSAGFTDDEIRAQGNKAWRNLAAEAYARLEAGQTTPTATTPGAITGPTYTAPTPELAALAQSAYSPTTGAFSNAINELTNRTGPAPTGGRIVPPPLQWWQRGTPTQAVTTAPGAPKVLPSPTAVRRSPFAGVTGSAGMTTGQPNITGGYIPSGSIAAWQTWQRTQPERPSTMATAPNVTGGYIPQSAIPAWRAWQGVPGANTGTSQTPTGTIGSRTIDPMTGIPDFPMLATLGTAPTTTYSGTGYYGSNWYSGKKRRRGRSRPSYAPGGYVSERDNGPFVPSSGQANWQIG